MYKNKFNELIFGRILATAGQIELLADVTPT